MLMLSMVLDEDDNDSLLLLYRCHLSLVHNNNFLFLLDSMFMNIDQKMLFLIFFQPTTTVPSTCWTMGGATTTRVSTLLNFVISTKGHKASSEEAFILTLTKLAAGSSNTSLMEVFGVSMDTFISRV
jgi:hypothetical protein